PAANGEPWIMRGDGARSVVARARAGQAAHADVRARRRRAVMAGDDVDDATDRVRAIQRGALRAANHFDAVDRVRIELRDEKRVRDLDAIDVHLRVARRE